MIPKICDSYCQFYETEYDMCTLFEERIVWTDKKEGKYSANKPQRCKDHTEVEIYYESGTEDIDHYFKE